MELAKYKACICEGAAEAAIIDILVDNDLLIFTREEMLEEQVIRGRNAKNFEAEKNMLYCLENVLKTYSAKGFEFRALR